MGNETSNNTQEVWDVESTRLTRSTSVHKGMRNLLGENNCFVNVVIQALWHLDTFRTLISVSKHSHSRPVASKACVCCALKNLFTQYQYSEEVILPPDDLRSSLSNLFEKNRFQVGSMDDATEVLEIILKYIHYDHIRSQNGEDDQVSEGEKKGELATRLFDVTTMQHGLDTVCNPSCISHTTFGYDSFDRRVCNKCGATADPQPARDFVYRVYVSELQAPAGASSSSSSAAALVTALRAAVAGPPGTCPDTSAAQEAQQRAGDAAANAAAVAARADGCGAEEAKAAAAEARRSVAAGAAADGGRLCSGKSRSERWCLNLPRVFCVCLAWPQNPSGQDISNALSSICQTMDLHSLFNAPAHLTARAGSYRFSGMVCYYGLHYVAFFVSYRHRAWLLFDDKNIKKIGQWRQVLARCLRGKLQPVMLFYESTHEAAPLVTPQQQAEAAASAIASAKAAAEQKQREQQQQQQRRGGGGDSDSKTPELLRFSCPTPSCKTRLLVPRTATTFQCPKCRTVLRRPAPPPPATPPPIPSRGQPTAADGDGDGDGGSGSESKEGGSGGSRGSGSSGSGSGSSGSKVSEEQSPPPPLPGLSEGKASDGRADQGGGGDGGGGDGGGGGGKRAEAGGEAKDGGSSSNDSSSGDATATAAAPPTVQLPRSLSSGSGSGSGALVAGGGASRLDAWEYELTFAAVGSKFGLTIDEMVRDGRTVVVVTNFSRQRNGDKLPVEASGLVGLLDVLLSVNGTLTTTVADASACLSAAAANCSNGGGGGDGKGSAVLRFRSASRKAIGWDCQHCTFFNVEAALPALPSAARPWLPDGASSSCMALGCSCRFSGVLSGRGGSKRHHCRSCGNLFCDTHSSATLPLTRVTAGSNSRGGGGGGGDGCERVRVCDGCFRVHQARKAAVRGECHVCSARRVSPALRTPRLQSQPPSIAAQLGRSGSSSGGGGFYGQPPPLPPLSPSSVSVTVSEGKASGEGKTSSGEGKTGSGEGKEGTEGKTNSGSEEGKANSGEGKVDSGGKTEEPTVSAAGSTDAVGAGEGKTAAGDGRQSPVGSEGDRISEGKVADGALDWGGGSGSDGTATAAADNSTGDRISEGKVANDSGSGDGDGDGDDGGLLASVYEWEDGGDDILVDVCTDMVVLDVMAPTCAELESSDDEGVVLVTGTPLPPSAAAPAADGSDGAATDTSLGRGGGGDAGDMVSQRPASWARRVHAPPSTAAAPAAGEGEGASAATAADVAMAFPLPPPGTAQRVDAAEAPLSTGLADAAHAMAALTMGGSAPAAAATASNPAVAPVVQSASGLPVAAVLATPGAAATAGARLPVASPSPPPGGPAPQMPPPYPAASRLPVAPVVGVAGLWSCRVCTFDNTGSNSTCVICTQGKRPF